MQGTSEAPNGYSPATPGNMCRYSLLTSSIGAVSVLGTYFRESASSSVHIGAVGCVGNEESLINCQLNELPECNDVASVVCQSKNVLCENINLVPSCYIIYSHYYING